MVGGILATAVAAVDYRHYERLGYALYAFGIVLLLLVFVLGRDIRGSSRWIYIGSFSLQPSELMKVFLIVALAEVPPRRSPQRRANAEGPRRPRGPDPTGLADVLLIALRQPDLGTAMIHGLIFLSVCALMRIHIKSVLSLLAAFAVLLPAIWTYVLKDYQRQRITSFLNPEANLLGANWHAHHARVAIGNGGWFGRGFMRGTQNQFLSSCPSSTATSPSPCSPKTGASSAA